MTLNEKKPSLLIGTDEDNQQEFWVEIDNKNLLLLAEMIADESTIRDRKALYNRLPAADDYSQEYDHFFSADYNRVLNFADTHNLKIEVLKW